MVNPKFVWQQRPRPNCTLVTALLQIGREGWKFYGRELKKYEDYFSVVLRLDIDMIIFITQEHYETVKSIRTEVGLWDRTFVWVITLKQLPLYKYLGKMQDVIEFERSDENWKSEWDENMKTHPEATSAEYDLLVNSKPYFMYNSTMHNHFNNKLFVWLDAGYGHGDEANFPVDMKWYPSVKEGKISMIKLTPDTDKVERYNIDNLYRKDWAAISGGFIGGDSTAVKTLYHYHFQKVLQLLHEKKVDDDQTVLLLLIKEMPELFDLEYGDWFDAFKLF
uniref:Uncharacterized protein n=1 Tax=Rhabditophanes sp. KR3021 TaxID=114890 RepID=A0AC35TVX6_9BILA